MNDTSSTWKTSVALNVHRNFMFHWLYIFWMISEAYVVSYFNHVNAINLDKTDKFCITYVSQKPFIKNMF